jgi:hypothetical protein
MSSWPQGLKGTCRHPGRQVPWCNWTGVAGSSHAMSTALGGSLVVAQRGMGPCSPTGGAGHAQY